MALMMVGTETNIVPLKTRYLQLIHENGFSLAHQSMLREIKFQLDRNPHYCGRPLDAMKEAIRIHTRLVFMAAFSRCALPPVKEIDRQFFEVFGELSRPFLSGQIQ